MSVEATITVTLAEVSVSDEYQIELRTRRRLTALDPDEAVQLANELMNAAREAVETLATDVGQPALPHPFDVAPICQRCETDHHSECNGQARVGGGWGVAACGCAEVDHKVLGGAA
jgi:hypothetical protein